MMNEILVAGSAAQHGVPAMGVTDEWLKRLLPDPADRVAYAEERIVAVLTEAIAEAMELEGVTRSQLAEKLGVTKGRVSRMLGGANLTVRTYGRILHALNREVQSVSLIKFGTVVVPSDQPIGGTAVGIQTASADQNRGSQTSPLETFAA